MKIRNRVFVKDHLEIGLTLTLDQRAAHYLFNVLRCQEDEYISIFNESNEWLSKIDKINSKDVQISIEKNIKSADKRKDITLYFSPIKKNQTELVIQKCTEIGVTNFQPVLMERTNFSSFNIDNLEKFLPNFITTPSKHESSNNTFDPAPKTNILPRLLNSFKKSTRSVKLSGLK